MTDIEGPIHRSILQYLRLVLPAGFLVHHCANKPRSKQQGAREKAMGALAGWPNLSIYGRDQGDRPCAWFFEVKAPGAPVPTYQRDLHDRLIDIGCKVAVVRSLDDVAACLDRWGVSRWRARQNRNGAVASPDTRMGREAEA